MKRHAFGQHAVAALIAACTTFGAAIAAAGTPTVLWQKTGIRTGPEGALFSADGSSLLLAIGGGFEVRRSSDGALQNTLNLPTASRGYDARALSHDKTLVGLTFLRGARPFRPNGGETASRTSR